MSDTNQHALIIPRRITIWSSMIPTFLHDLVLAILAYTVLHKNTKRDFVPKSQDLASTLLAHLPAGG